MFNFFKKKRKNFIINCKTDEITINDVNLTFPTNYQTLVTVFGEPTRELEKSKNYMIWDKDGILCSYTNPKEILSIDFYQNNPTKSEYNTKKQFKGTLFLNYESITNNEFSKIALGSLAIHRLGSENEIRFGFSLGVNNIYKQ